MPDNCRHWQGLLAEHALSSHGGSIEDAAAMSDELAEHVAGCAECQATAAEFRATAAALGHTTEPIAVHVANAMSSGMSSRIAARVDLERQRHRRNRRRQFVAAGAVAAAILVVVSMMAIRHHDSTEVAGEQVALTSSGVNGDATLQPQAWGTQIHLAVTGSTPGQRYNVWLERADGSRVGAGTFTGVRNTSISVVLSSALPSGEAVAIGISEPNGDLVVRAPLD
jgi:anti-sigma-K factor RskA